MVRIRDWLLNRSRSSVHWSCSRSAGGASWLFSEAKRGFAFCQQPGQIFPTGILSAHRTRDDLTVNHHLVFQQNYGGRRV